MIYVLLALALLGAAAITAGVALLTGLAWALIAAGIAALVAVVVLYDPAAVRAGLFKARRP